MMNHQQLSARLETVAYYVPGGAALADIGSDHAYLPVFLADRKQIRFGVAGEINDGPLKSAEENIRKAGYSSIIRAKKGSGLEVIADEPEIDTVVIAGMGGPLIRSILDEGKQSLADVKRLILQPNIAADRIRTWLMKEDWDLIDEAILEEDGHIYEILIAEKGTGTSAYHTDQDIRMKELWLGPHLIRKPNSAFQKKWEWEYKELNRIKEQLLNANNQDQVKERLNEVNQKLLWLKEESIDG